MIPQHQWQSRIHLAMDGIMIGSGWHEIEVEDNIFYRWSGPDQTSSIHLNPARDAECRLNLTIHAAANEYLLQNLELKLDGRLLVTTVSKSRNPTYITTILPVDNLKRKDQDTILTFHFNTPLTSLSNNKSRPDKRAVGIALQRVDIFPLSRPLFIAQKYTDPEPFDGLQYMHNHPGVRDAVIQGQYASAYEYCLKHRDNAPNGRYDLHQFFDECPGDLYDIIKQDMQEGFELLKDDYHDELKRLRNIVNRQGDTIRALQNQLHSSKSDQ